MRFWGTLGPRLFLTAGPGRFVAVKLKQGELANGKAAWDGVVTKYQNSTRQRRRILTQELAQMVMTEGQYPDIFVNYVQAGPAKTLKIDKYRCAPLSFSSSDLKF